jgi:hypothetical protein
MKWPSPVLAAALCGAALPTDAADLRLANARYVAIVFNVGTGLLPETTVSPEVLREEREAAQRIRAALENQGRFVFVDRPSRADLLLSIRKGRLGSVEASTQKGGAPVGSPWGPGAPPRASRETPAFGVQFSSRDDQLEVLNPEDGALIWRTTKPKGWVGEGPPLLLALQAEVAKADAAAATKAP